MLAFFWGSVASKQQCPESEYLLGTFIPPEKKAINVRTLIKGRGSKLSRNPVNHRRKERRQDFV